MTTPEEDSADCFVCRKHRGVIVILDGAIMVARLSRALKVSEGAEHVYAFGLGDHVAHLHIHLAPRYPGAPREYWGVRVDGWPDAPRGGADEIAELWARLLTALRIV